MKGHLNRTRDQGAPPGTHLLSSAAPMKSVETERFIWSGKNDKRKGSGRDGWVPRGGGPQENSNLIARSFWNFERELPVPE